MGVITQRHEIILSEIGASGDEDNLQDFRGIQRPCLINISGRGLLLIVVSDIHNRLLCHNRHRFAGQWIGRMSWRRRCMARIKLAGLGFRLGLRLTLSLFVHKFLPKWISTR
jgi:hypothetical protein